MSPASDKSPRRTEQILIGVLIGKLAWIQAWGFAIPVFFILLKLIGTDPLISLQTADSLVQVLSSAWSSLGPQYQAFKRLDLLVDAANYALFYSCLFVLFAYALLENIRVSIANRNRIVEAKSGEIFRLFIVILIGGVGVYYAMLLDPVRPNTRPGFGFAIDSYGFYYVRQWVVFSSINILVLLLVPTVVVWTRRIFAGTRHPK